jgi:oxalate decarboxylase/phosphoglucose isomerase-like protein (cupin superfamily)
VGDESKKLTFVEEDDVETQVFDWGRLSWLTEPRVTAAGRFSAGVVTLEPGKGHDRHNHPGVEEILYVLEGRGRQTVQGPGTAVEREVGPGVLVHIPPDVYHSTINIGDGPLRIMAVYSPYGPEAELREMEGVRIEPPKRQR